MKTCVVTCTGGRPELFALCRRWVERQTVKPDEWVITTDVPGEDDSYLPKWAKHVKIAFGDGPNNALVTALACVPLDHAVIVMEDDDWYAPNHIETCLERLDLGFPATCGSTAIRFHLPARKWTDEHVQKGLIQGTVGIHPTFVQRYMHMVNAGPLDDHELSKGCYPRFTSIGIKGVGYGLPGRKGRTNAHDPKHRKVTMMKDDPGHEHFKKTIGKDADAYLELLR